MSKINSSRDGETKSKLDDLIEEDTKSGTPPDKNTPVLEDENRYKKETVIQDFVKKKQELGLQIISV